MRYVLPAFPAVFILASSVFHESRTGSPAKYLATITLLWSVISSLLIWPHSRSYFHELIGGPKQGHWYMGGSFIDTNIDCGQDLLYLKKWIGEHPEANGLKVSFNGAVSPTLAGIVAEEPPRGPRSVEPSTPGDPPGPTPGWHAISVNHLHMRTHDYDYFLDFEPVDRVGYSIHIYRITVEQADEWHARHSE